MKVNFDGMRRKATNNMNDLQDSIIAFLKCDDDAYMEQLVYSFNEAAQSVDAFNCLFDDNDSEDVNDLSEELSIKQLKLCEE
jgi:hypothetical protein